MKKLIVFGATGKTGLQVVKQALDLGFEVTAIVRNPSSLNISNEHLNIIKGNVYDPATFEKYLSAQNIVISCLGQGYSRKSTTVYSKGIENIISKMKENKANRIICVSASALDNNEEGLYGRLEVKIGQFVLKKPFADLRIMEKELKQSSLDWTIVRPPQLKNNTITGIYRTSINTPLKKCRRIGRADLAQYMLKILDNPESYKSIIEIAY